MNKVTIDRELLPCPFCGGTDLHSEPWCVMPDNYHASLVSCADCEFEGPSSLTLPEPDGCWMSDEESAIAEGIKAWNRRAAPRHPDSNPFFDNRIARELLEDREKQWPMSAPRQPEGEGLEVVGAAAISNDGTVLDMSTEHYIRRNWEGHAGYQVEPLCRLSDAQRAIAELRGLTPELPPRPPEGEGMPRYGLRWNGPQQPVAVPMADGYWTPSHLAEAECDTLRHHRNKLADLLKRAHGFTSADSSLLYEEIRVVLEEVQQ